MMLDDIKRKLTKDIEEFCDHYSASIDLHVFEPFAARKTANKAARKLRNRLQRFIKTDTPPQMREVLVALEAELTRFDLARLWKSPTVPQLVGEHTDKVQQIPPRQSPNATEVM